MTVMIMLVSFLTYDWPPKNQPQPTIDSTEILFGGEYVMLGDIEQPATDEMATPEPENKEEAKPSPEPTQHENLVSTNRESTMKVEKQKEQPKDTKKKSDKATAETKKNDNRDNAKAKEISNNVSSSFGKGKGKQGSQNGNSNQGVAKGTPGYSLSGRTPESWGRPSSPSDGTITIRVKVNPKGKVTDATYVRGSGSANASMAVRESCRQASLRSRFSVATDRTTDQIGTITWRFE